eukprot:Phypoly_transcript_20448.p2 GENE.Phypoly_transcript_20448~~Phypoly_transcript_20448.p2  ORF type:complete len:139 (+),score=18.99 Phypoly_transcript_20448:225-641(+)
MGYCIFLYFFFFFPVFLLFTFSFALLFFFILFSIVFSSFLFGALHFHFLPSQLSGYSSTPTLCLFIYLINYLFYIIFFDAKIKLIRCAFRGDKDGILNKIKFGFEMASSSPHTSLHDSPQTSSTISLGREPNETVFAL